jgi:Fic family protein
MYIYNKKGWPSFTWKQEKIIPLLSLLRHKQGLLLGGMKSIGFQMQNEAFLKTLTQEAVKTSAIEGEILDPELVRSSVARHLGIETAASSA